MKNSIAEQFDEIYNELKVIEKEERLIIQRKSEQTEKRFELCKKIISTIKKVSNETFIVFDNNKPELISDAILYLMPFYGAPNEDCPEKIKIGYYKTYECGYWRKEIVDVEVAYPKAWFDGESWIEEYKAAFNSLITNEETKEKNNRKLNEIKEKELFLELKQKFEPQTSEKL